MTTVVADCFALLGLPFDAFIHMLGFADKIWRTSDFIAILRTCKTLRSILITWAQTHCNTTRRYYIGISAPKYLLAEYAFGYSHWNIPGLGPPWWRIGEYCKPDLHSGYLLSYYKRGWMGGLVNDFNIDESNELLIRECGISDPIILEKGQLFSLVRLWSYSVVEQLFTADPSKSNEYQSLWEIYQSQRKIHSRGLPWRTIRLQFCDVQIYNHKGMFDDSVTLTVSVKHHAAACLWHFMISLKRQSWEEIKRSLSSPSLDDLSFYYHSSDRRVACDNLCCKL